MVSRLMVRRRRAMALLLTIHVVVVMVMVAHLAMMCPIRIVTTDRMWMVVVCIQMVMAIMDTVVVIVMSFTKLFAAAESS